MLVNDKEKAICRKYSARDKDGYVHCNECPLVVDREEHACKSFMHYNKHNREWEIDE